jgi:hypothetical protein
MESIRTLPPQCSSVSNDYGAGENARAGQIAMAFPAAGDHISGVPCYVGPVPFVHPRLR